MRLSEEKAATWHQQPGDDSGPPVDVREPTQRAHPRVDQVEPFGPERFHSVVDVSWSEGDIRTGGGREAASFLQCGEGEIQPGHTGAEAGQRDCVSTDV